VVTTRSTLVSNAYASAYVCAHMFNSVAFSAFENTTGWQTNYIEQIPVERIYE